MYHIICYLNANQANKKILFYTMYKIVKILNAE